MLLPPETCSAREIGRYRIQQDTIGASLEYLIKQYPLDTGALEIQYIEEYFGEFPRKKTGRISSIASASRVPHLMRKRRCPTPRLVVPVRTDRHELREREDETSS